MSIQSRSDRERFSRLRQTLGRLSGEIRRVIEPDSWGARGTSVRGQGEKLVVVHIEKVHKQVRQLLKSFTDAREPKKPRRVKPPAPPPPFKVAGLKDEELVEIYVATLAHMLKNAEDWDQKVERRFVSAIGRAPHALLERLRGAGFKVQSPYVKDPTYTKGRFTGGRYGARGDTSLFYSVNGVRKVTVNEMWISVRLPDGGSGLQRIKGSKTRVIVSCSVLWHGLAARGYRYTFEMKKGKWTITQVMPTWMS